MTIDALQATAFLLILIALIAVGWFEVAVLVLAAALVASIVAKWQI